MSTFMFSLFLLLCYPTVPYLSAVFNTATVFNHKHTHSHCRLQLLVHSSNASSVIIPLHEIQHTYSLNFPVFNYLNTIFSFHYVHLYDMYPMTSICFHTLHICTITATILLQLFQAIPLYNIQLLSAFTCLFTYLHPISYCCIYVHTVCMMCTQ